MSRNVDRASTHFDRGGSQQTTLPRYRIPAAVAELRRQAGESVIVGTGWHDGSFLIVGKSPDMKSVVSMTSIVIEED